MSDVSLLHPKVCSAKPAIEVGAGAPQPELCQVGALDPGCEGGWCLVRPIPYCTFGFPYGHGYLCRHPEIHRIIARTRALRLSRKPVQD